MSAQIAVRLADEQLQRLDAAIARGVYASRAEAVRAGLERLLAEEREHEIAAAYQRAYGHAPDDLERQVGEAGLALGSRLLANDDTGGGGGRE